jgi:hypothetical protein
LRNFVFFLKKLILNIYIRDFLVSRIIDESLSQKLEELLEKKDLNCQKWSLLYRGSRDGFRASNFHSHCDNKPITLTIIKSTSGNIFGGFTSAHWNQDDSWQRVYIQSCEQGEYTADIRAII